MQRTFSHAVPLPAPAKSNGQAIYNLNLDRLAVKFGHMYHLWDIITNSPYTWAKNNPGMMAGVNVYFFAAIAATPPIPAARPKYCN